MLELVISFLALAFVLTAYVNKQRRAKRIAENQEEKKNKEISKVVSILENIKWPRN